MSSDPVGEGLVESLAHPEGNVTGFSFFATPTTGKLLEVLKETLPGLSRLGVIDEPELATNSTYLALVKAAAASLNIKRRGVGFLDFLVSGKKDLERFALR